MTTSLYTRSRVKEKNDYKRLGIKYCSPAKIIKKYIKDIFDAIQGELKKKKLRNLEDFVKKTKDDFFEGCDYSCIFNSRAYSEVLNLYLFYFSLYKKYGFSKDYFDKVIIKNGGKPINCLDFYFNYFYTKEFPKIELENNDKNIILLRELPFFLEDYFKKKEKQVSIEIIYMFSFLYLYHLIDYEFLLSTNEFNLEQKKLFIKPKLYSYIFNYILERNHKDCLKKYTVNEKIMKLLEENDDHITKFPFNCFLLPFFSYLLDYKNVEEVMKKGFDDFSYDKYLESNNGLFDGISNFINNKSGETPKVTSIQLRKELTLKILTEKIVYLVGGIMSLNFFKDTNFSALEYQENNVKSVLKKFKKLKDLLKFSLLYKYFCENN